MELNLMYKYLLFTDMNYYPAAGMGSCIAKLHSLDDVMSAIKSFSETFDDFYFIEYIQFYDAENDITYYVDVDKLKDEKIIEYDKSDGEPYLNWKCE